MEEEQKLSPIRRIARELEPHSSLSEDEIVGSIIRIISVLQGRAEDEIKRNAESEMATEVAMEFLAFTELIAIFGSGLLAHDAAESPPSKEMQN